MSATVIPFPVRTEEPPAHESAFARAAAALGTLQHGTAAERERAAGVVAEALAELVRLASRAA